MAREKMLIVCLHKGTIHLAGKTEIHFTTRAFYEVPFAE